ncbi:MAG TPA: hypothetical protein VLG50_08300 [Candidatus Saccharimonadales bacterium]|nr:hypothetical protein [Candidatus Saccharimonadales bacterium]
MSLQYFQEDKLLELIKGYLHITEDEEEVVIMHNILSELMEYNCHIDIILYLLQDKKIYNRCDYSYFFIDHPI